MRALADDEQGYFFYLPSHYPYVIKRRPDTFVVQFGGGISTMVALAGGARRVTVAINNPEVLAAFRDQTVRAFTGDVVADPRVHVVDFDGRLYLAQTANRYDVIDLNSPTKSDYPIPAASRSSRNTPIRARRCSTTCGR